MRKGAPPPPGSPCSPPSPPGSSEDYPTHPPKRVSKEQRTPLGMLPNPCNMAFLDTKSNAPIPSTDTTVCRGFISVNICTMCDTHSHPDFVCNAFWCGAVASSTCFEICWAMVHAINLRMSPTTMPRIPPSRLRRTVPLVRALS